VSAAREAMLASVRHALGDAPRPPLDVPRTYRGAGPAAAVPNDDSALLGLLADRLVDYRAGVRRCDADGLPAAIDEALRTGIARRAAGPGDGRVRVVVPEGLDDGWLATARAGAGAGAGAGAEIVVDGQGDARLDVPTLDGCDAVITAARVAIAETGTIVLDAAPDQGRRALTLVPDVHVCVVGAEQVVANVPDAMPLIDPTRPLTWISGPSATSDIELDRVEGVHGPRILEVVLVR
jgi:L-lactate dehydrogenase complex protein LldG